MGASARVVDQLPIDAPPSEKFFSPQTRHAPAIGGADLMLFGNRGKSLLTLHERCSRLMLALPLTSKEAEPTAHALAQMLEVVPA